MLLLFSFLFLCLGTESSNDDIYIELTIENVKTTEGNMLVSLYSDSDGFPYEPKTYFMLPKDGLNDGVLVLRVKVDRVGKYALTVVDDTNANGDMDKNFVGVPKEGFAFSNNAKPRGLRPPLFDDAVFHVGENGAEHQVTLKYF